MPRAHLAQGAEAVGAAVRIEAVVSLGLARRRRGPGPATAAGEHQGWNVGVWQRVHHGLCQEEKDDRTLGAQRVVLRGILPATPCHQQGAPLFFPDPRPAFSGELQSPRKPVPRCS